jgi:hypothetical protein
MTDVARTYAPALADLMEHEKVIEQGLGTFIDVGNALVAIRDGKKYEAAGYLTFEIYCNKRWGFSRAYAYRVLAASETVRLLSPMGDTPAPATERQVRSLNQLRDKPERMREAWADAVEASGGKPTARDVEAAVAKRVPPKKDHPAPFSNDILDVIADRVRGVDVVLDPFAGTGRVHELRERAGVGRTIGVEIEPEWAATHPDTIHGSVLALPLADCSVGAIVTSPTYGNRMADHHEATDDSVRLTYKHTLGRDLAVDNSGAMQWGDEYREFHRQAWAESVRTLEVGGLFVLNIKDHIRDGVRQEVAAWHVDTLCREFALALIAVDVIPTKGLMAGENHKLRSCAELVFTFRKAEK